MWIGFGIKRDKRVALESEGELQRQIISSWGLGVFLKEFSLKHFQHIETISEQIE